LALVGGARSVEFEREQFAAWTSLVAIYLLVLLIAAAFFVVFWEWREGTMGFRLPLGLKVGLPFTFLAALQMLNGTANFWSSYPTSLPPIAWLFITVLRDGLLLVVIALIVTGFVGSFEPNWMVKRLPEMVPLSVWLSRRRNDPELAATALCHPAAFRDAIAFGYLASFAFWHLFNETTLNALLLRGSWLPFVDYLAWTAWATLLLLLFGIAFAGTYRRYIRTPQRLFILLLLLLPVGLIGTHSATEALKQFAEWTARFVHHSGAPLLAGSVRPSPQPLCLGFGHRLADAFVHQPSVASSTRCVLEGTSDSVACPLRFARPLVAAALL
jgi:hypothetical protein